MAEHPTRLHHSAVVVKDLGASRKFYGDIMGMPLLATWYESNAEMGDFCHAFFGMEDGSAVALFQFADPDRYEAARRPENLSRFHHLAMNGSPEYQAAVKERADAAGLAHRTINHGYCTSLYLDDPDGHVVEVSYDNDIAVANSQFIRERAAAELERWLNGDHRTNNDLRDAVTTAE